MAALDRDAPSPILIVAGEVSGDIHAANMLSHLRQLIPAIEAFGVGGERLEAAGLQCLHHTSELAHMGLVEVLRELPRIRAIMRHLADESARQRPRLAVLVDSPDFNLRLARRLARLSIPVVLYVSPQLWAWRRGRVKTVRRLAREVLCILPFEVPFYQQHRVVARYVGHPLVDDLDQAGLVGHDIEVRPRRLALLPGSRAMEVRQLLPVMLQSLRELSSQEVAEAVLVEAPGIGSVIDGVLEEHGSDPRVQRVAGPERRRALAASRLAWTASGTATLECALLDVPMVVGYRLQAFSYALAKLLVRVPHVALANLIAGERVTPELLQGEWCVERLVHTTSQMLSGGAEAQRPGLAIVRERLGDAGASRRAAEAVAESLERTG